MKYQSFIIIPIVIALLFFVSLYVGSFMAPLLKSVYIVAAPKIVITMPSQLLDLKSWKLTLPTGDDESPDEIKQPELASYSNQDWFRLNDAKTAVLFRAPVSGVTTSGSGYPRSELREMDADGKTRSSWSSTTGTHTMTLEEAVTAVPSVKKQVVAAQIHDADDDVLVIRLDYPRLYVNVDGKNKFMLDQNYTFGRKFTIKLVVSNGKTSVYYNNGVKPVYTLDKKYKSAYFKAGAYTQSNCEKEVVPWLCNDNNYGEVQIYSLKVSHSP